MATTTCTEIMRSRSPALFKAINQESVDKFNRFKKMNDDNHQKWKNKIRKERRIQKRICRQNLLIRSILYPEEFIVALDETEVESKPIYRWNHGLKHLRNVQRKENRRLAFTSRVPIQYTPIWESPYYTVERDSPFSKTPYTREKPKKKQELPFMKLQDALGILDAMLDPSSLLEGLFNFDACVDLKDLTIEKVLEFLADLKPMTLSLLLTNYIAARSASEKYAVLCCLWETFNVYWNTEIQYWKKFLIGAGVQILDWIISKCWSSVRDELGCSDDFVIMEDQGIAIKEDGFLHKVFQKCGIHSEELPFTEETGFLVTTVLIVLAIITGGTFAGLTNNSLSKIIKRLNKFSTTIKSVSNISEYLPKLWDQTLGCVASLLGFEHFGNDAEVQKFIDKVLGLKKEAHDLNVIIRHRPWEIMQDQSVLKRITSKYEELDEVYRDLLKQKKNLSASKPIFDELKELVKGITEYAETIKHTTCRKQEPWVLMISGKPGIGKSQMMNWFTEQVCHKKNAKDGTNFIPTYYVRNASTKHYDGYHGQLFVVYDDFGAQKADVDHSDIMFYKNPNKAIVPKALPHEKGMHFSSIGFILLTNVENIDSSASIKCPTALQRRMEVNIYAHDPNWQRFVDEHDCTPAEYQKRECLEPMTTDEDGKEIPYYDKEFDYIQFFLKPSYASTSKQMREMTKEQIVDMIMRYDDEYTNTFKASLATNATFQQVQIPAETNLADVVRLSDLAAKYDGEIETKPKVEEQVAPQPIPQEPSQAENATAATTVDNVSIKTTSSGRRRKDNAEDVVKLIHAYEGKQIQLEGKAQLLKNAVRKNVVDPDVYAEEIVKPGIEWKTTIEGAYSQFTKRQQKHLREKNNFIQRHMNTKGSTRAEAEMAYRQFDGYKDEGVAEDSATAFVEPSMEQGKIFIFYGAPGTGKSTIQKQLYAMNPDCQYVHCSDLTTFVPSHPVVFIEDPTQTEIGFRIFENLVLQCYDDSSVVKTIIASINYEVMKTYFTDNEALSRFVRRCEWVQFKYNVKKKNYIRKDELYTAEDVKKNTGSYLGMVSIIHEGQSIGDTELRSIVNDAIATTKVIKIPISVRVPYISSKDYVPDFVVQLPGSIETAFKEYYDDPMKMVKDMTLRKVKLLKGSLRDGIHIAKQFTSASNNKIKWPGSFDEFIVTVNNSQMKCTIPFKTEIQALDGKLLIVPQNTPPNTILMFRVNEQFTRSADGKTFSDAETEAVKPNEVTERIYTDVLKATKQAERLDEVVEELTETTTQSINIYKIFTEIPSLEKITAILIFILKLANAGVVIGTLFSAAKKRFQQLPYEDEGSRKMKKISKKYGMHGSFYLYDSLRDTIEKRYGNSAKKMRVSTAIDRMIDLYGDDFLDDLDAEIFDRMLERLERESNDVKTETREVQVVVNKPNKVTLQDPLEIEQKKTIITPQKEPDLGEEEPAPYSLEALADPVIKDMINVAYEHSVDIYSGDNHENFRCHGLMVHGKIGATVSHIFDVTQKYWVKTYKGIKPTFHELTPVKIYERLDLLVFKVPSKSFPSYSSIRHLLPKRRNELVRNVSNRSALLVIPDKMEGTKEVHSVRITGSQEVKTQSGEYLGLGYSAVFMNSAKVQTPINTQAGDCGSVIVVNDRSVVEKIVGLHHAADNFKAHASFLYQELFEDQFILQAMSEIKSTRVVNPHHEIHVETFAQEALLGMPIAGEGDLKVFRPKKSQLWTSPLSLPDAHNYEPSIIDPYDCRNSSSEDPFYRSVAKWNNPQPKMKEDLLDRVVDDIGYWYAMQIKSRNITTSVLTKTEAINSGAQYNVQPINRKSAAGYPWAKYGKKETFLCNKGTGNQAYYGIDLKKQCGRNLNASIDFIIETCRHPHQHVAIPFSGWLKDEPVKMKKIYDVNTRSFTGAPFDYTIAYRRYFSTIYGAIHSVRDIMPIQVGINPTSMEWHWMTMRLLSCSDSGFDLDFQGFDSTLPAIVQQKMVKIHNKIAQYNDPNWTEEDDIIRTNLHQSLVKPLIIVPIDGQSLILQAPGGQPSGHPGTADDNSLAHLIYLYYAWLEIMIFNGRSDLCSLTAFVDHVQAIIYGDDGGYAVSPEVQDIFNFETVAAVLNELGIKCTPASKGNTICKIIKVKEFEFLKRDFVKRGAYWFGPLKKMSFEKMLGFCLGPSHHWHKDQKVAFADRLDDLIATAESALREAAIHGKEFYTEMAKHLHSRLSELDSDWFPPLYGDMVVLLGLPLPL